MKVNRVFVPLITLAVIIGAGSTAAHADEPDIPAPASVPTEVQSWFDAYAMVEVISTMASTSDLPRTDGVDYTKGAVGEIRPVYAWTADFLDGSESAVPVERIDEWVAPILVDGSPVGTISAWRNPDTQRIEMASFLEDVATTAQALADQPDDAIVVQDRNNGTFFVDGDTVTQAVESQDATVEASLGSAQDQLAEQLEEIQQAEEASGEQLMGMSPIILHPDTVDASGSNVARIALIGSGVAIVLAGAAALLLARSKRLSSAAVA